MSIEFIVIALPDVLPVKWQAKCQADKGIAQTQREIGDEWHNEAQPKVREKFQPRGYNCSSSRVSHRLDSDVCLAMSTPEDNGNVSTIMNLANRLSSYTSTFGDQSYVREYHEEDISDKGYGLSGGLAVR